MPPLSLEERLAERGATPCETDPSFLCFTLEHPLDHADPERGTIELAYAVRPASGVSLGMLVTLYGGPGYSGVELADDFSTVDPTLRDEFDLAYFNLRGVRGPGELECPLAADAFYHPGLRAGLPAEDALVAARADSFGTACAAETGVLASDLPRYTSAQAVEDLDAFRAELELPVMTLYGLSYGTQLAQAYATTYPARVRALVLDGVVDLSRPNVEFASDATRATNDILDRVFAACAADPRCATLFPLTASLAFDQLARDLAVLPRILTLPVSIGPPQERSFTLADLDTVATIAMYDEGLRVAFLDALSSYAIWNDLIPMLVLHYDLSGYDPDTTLPYEGSIFSDAVYYTITCNDFGHPPGESVAERQQPWLDGGHALRDEPTLRLFSHYYGDLPCATWPSGSLAAPLPEPFEPPAPTLFINADADAATPSLQGERMFDRLAASGAAVSVIHVLNGHHVMLGTGEPCVDEPAAAFLRAPSAVSHGAETTCDATLIESFGARRAPRVLRMTPRLPR
ncbi:MAG: alpha/beta hydrolase [Myxococcales bacterium]|nr:alpha/beta hydrolase [Myxococcales bacterium]